MVYNISSIWFDITLTTDRPSNGCRSPRRHMRNWEIEKPPWVVALPVISFLGFSPDPGRDLQPIPACLLQA